MVRKRGVARKSSPHRRVRRVKKYDHVVIPRRFKIQLPDLSDRIEPELKEFVELEPFVEAELTVKGVPTSQWQYYHGFAKRMLALYLNFTGETLQKEKQSLINEYVLRGYSLNVLEQEQDVVEKYVVPPLNCADVKACLEGNYSSWAFQWKRAYGGDSYPCSTPHFVNINESSDFLWIYDPYNYNIQQLKVSDGTLLTEFGVLDYGNEVEFINYSLLMKYFAVVINDGGVPYLKIYKNGSLQQSINLQTACGWTDVAKHYVVTMSTDGKYILVSNFFDNEYALFMGS